MKPSLLLVHGAWHSGAGFAALQKDLHAVGIDSRTVNLTSVAKSGEVIGDMYQDAKLIEDSVAKIDGEVAVLGHSYGGLPITQGLAHAKNVSSLIYLTAFMLNEGETLYGACGNQDPEWWVRTNNERLTTKNPEEIFYNTCAPDIAKTATMDLREQSLLAFNQPITSVAWQKIKSTYIICEKDNAIPVFAQEAMSKRANQVFRMNTDHSPFLSKPAELAALISKII